MSQEDRNHLSGVLCRAVWEAQSEILRKQVIIFFRCSLPLATQGIHCAGQPGKLDKQKLVLGSKDEQRQEMFFAITVTWILEICLNGDFPE